MYVLSARLVSHVLMDPKAAEGQWGLCTAITKIVGEMATTFAGVLKQVE